MAVEGGVTVLREAGPWQGVQWHVGLVHRAARGMGVQQLQRGYGGQDRLRHGIGRGVGGGGGTTPGSHIRMLSGSEGHHRNRLPIIRIHNVQSLAPPSWARCWEVCHWWLICMRMWGVCSPHCHRRSRCAYGARRQRTGVGPSWGRWRSPCVVVLMLVGIVVSRPVRERSGGAGISSNTDLLRRKVGHRGTGAHRRCTLAHAARRVAGPCTGCVSSPMAGDLRGGAHRGGRGDGGRGSEWGLGRQGRGAPPAGTPVRGWAGRGGVRNPGS